MIVKPREPGLVIRDPRTRIALPDEGGRVPDTSFWHRRVRDGDVAVTHVDPKPKATPATKAKPKAAKSAQESTDAQ